ncbi:HNH endonuclease [Alcanivorax sp.]|uniref:HNH endonuclease n=1 Tax=Alcanivorax sp. TaxID=1872427 RepID=UPI002B278311|nr:HNH endonuclease [Alcanivorax sp.]
MKNLRRLPPPYIEYFDIIVAEKNETYRGVRNETKARLLALREEVLEKFNHYQDKFDFDVLHEVENSPYTGVDKDALVKAYTSSNKKLDLLKSEIKSIQDRDLQNICPYCGILTPNSTDHYVPKDDYPEYSILAVNLVPCCLQCNGKKGDFWKSGGGRGVINFYLDSLPQEEILECRVGFDGGIPEVEFSLNNHCGIDLNLFGLISSHYKRLNLFERFKDSSNDEITSTLDSVQSCSSPSSIEEVRGMLLINRDKKIARYGINYWKCALLKGLAHSDEFCDMAMS